MVHAVHSSRLLRFSKSSRFFKSSILNLTRRAGLAPHDDASVARSARD